MSDDANETPAADPAATLCSALVILTGVMLLTALLVVNSLIASQYPGREWF